MAEVTFAVPTIDCEGCARAIRGSLADVPGVNQVRVEVPTKRVSVDYDPSRVTPEAVEDQLVRSGFVPEETDAE